MDDSTQAELGLCVGKKEALTEAASQPATGWVATVNRAQGVQADTRVPTCPQSPPQGFSPSAL